MKLTFEEWLVKQNFYGKEQFVQQNIEELSITREAAEKRWVQVEKQLRTRYEQDLNKT
ncbi:hypothetical protein [Desulfuribacillus stibiiarsenatis]|uniref:hypothetical protein n=1 Tax=Desulfuribacillus stibiiarsenatis TaxID=1390249 RepID=UPI0015B617FE|nr:hypothetical protein [Desulfuribacillus stibiiarsenatis]